MKKHFQRLAAFVFVTAALAACVSPLGMDDSQSSDQVATAAAMTLQALAPEAVDKTPSLLPRRLYYLGRDSQGLAQAFRMQQDARQKLS